MPLILLALGDIHRRFEETDRVAGNVAQRSDVQVVPARAAWLGDLDLALARFAGADRLALVLVGGEQEAAPGNSSSVAPSTLSTGQA